MNAHMLREVNLKCKFVPCQEISLGLSTRNIVDTQ